MSNMWKVRDACYYGASPAIYNRHRLVFDLHRSREHWSAGSNKSWRWIYMIWQAEVLYEINWRSS